MMLMEAISMLRDRTSYNARKEADDESRDAVDFGEVQRKRAAARSARIGSAS
jgi:hypothetical protein